MFLAIHLKVNAQWRRGNSGPAINDGSDGKKYGKDMHVEKTVLLIATAFTFLGTLSAIRHLMALHGQTFAQLVVIEIFILPQRGCPSFSCKSIAV